MQRASSDNMSVGNLSVIAVCRRKCVVKVTYTNITDALGNCSGTLGAPSWECVVDAESPSRS